MILLHIYTGGKTGGHITPIINLAKDDYDYLYIGCKGFLEEKLAKDNNISFLGLKFKKSIPSYIFNGYRELKRNLKNKKIDYVFSTGGFVSLPILFYAVIHNIPIFLFEPNIIIGRSNRLFYPFCKRMLLGYPVLEKRKTTVTGIPLDIKKAWLKNKYDILIMGGSLGSRYLCDLAVSLSDKYRILLIAGRFYNEYRELCNSIEYSNNIYSLFEESKIIISRSGAITSSELIYMNKPFILVPSEKTLDNHQVINAKYFNDKGVCLVHYENEDINSIFDKLHYLNNSDNYINIYINQKKLLSNDSINKIREIIKNDMC